MVDNNLSASAEPDVTTSAQSVSFDDHVEDLTKALQDDPSLLADPVVEEKEETDFEKMKSVRKARLVLSLFLFATAL